MSTPRETLWAFINTRIGIPWSQDFRALGVVRNDCLTAVVAYNGFTGRSCFMHDAIDDASVINRQFVRAVLDYPFKQCKLTHVMAWVDSKNDKALSLNAKLGFREVHRLDGGGLEGDLILLQLTPNTVKFGVKYGKEITSASA